MLDKEMYIEYLQEIIKKEQILYTIRKKDNKNSIIFVLENQNLNDFFKQNNIPEKYMKLFVYYDKSTNEFNSSFDINYEIIDKNQTISQENEYLFYKELIEKNLLREYLMSIYNYSEQINKKNIIRYKKKI